MHCRLEIKNAGALFLHDANDVRTSCDQVHGRRDVYLSQGIAQSRKPMGVEILHRTSIRVADVATFVSDDFNTAPRNVNTPHVAIGRFQPGSSTEVVTDQRVLANGIVYAKYEKSCHAQSCCVSLFRMSCNDVFAS